MIRAHQGGGRSLSTTAECWSTARAPASRCIEELKKAGCRVEPYPFTHASKSALIDNLSLLLEQKKLVLPRPEIWPEGIDELEAFEFSVTDSGTVRTGARAHDDCVIALALAAKLLPKTAEMPPWVLGQFEHDRRLGPYKDRMTRWREL